MNVELPESVVNGRFKYLDKPVTLPGKCAVCGAVNKPVIDFGLDLDYYGTVVICVECMHNAMQVVGLYENPPTAPVVPPLDYLDVEAVNEYLTRANASITSLNAILAVVRGTLVDAETAEEHSRFYDEPDTLPFGEFESVDSTSLVEGPISVSTDSSDESTKLGLADL